KIKKWRGSGPFLAHEDERNAGLQTKQRAGGTKGPRRNQPANAIPKGAVANLIVIRNAEDELLRHQMCAMRRGGSTRPSMLQYFHQLAQTPAESGGVNRPFEQRNLQVVMKIVGPSAIEVKARS